MSMEDLEAENVDRIERLLIEKHGKLSAGLTNNIHRIRQELLQFEIDEILLQRVADVMYEASLVNDIKNVEESIKYLSDTFYHQMGGK